MRELLIQILKKNHGHLSLMNDEDMAVIRKAIRKIDGNKLKILLEAWRFADKSIAADKAKKTKLEKDPDFFSRIVSKRYGR